MCVHRGEARRASGTTPFDVIVRFVTREADLARDVETVKRRLHPDGGLWIAWPKKASGVATDVTEHVVRAHALDAGLVDNKVCAIDDVWSGLRVVYRVADRPKAKASPRKPTRKR